VAGLLGFAVQGVEPVKFAVFFQFHAIRIILFIFCRMIIPSFAFSASQRHFNSHSFTPPCSQFPSYFKSIKMPGKNPAFDSLTGRIYHIYSSLSTKCIFLAQQSSATLRNKGSGFA